MKISEAIERRFRNVDIEYQVAAYTMRQSPIVAVSLQEAWFTVEPLRGLNRVLKELRVVLTKASALEELKKVVSASEHDLYEECLNQVMRARIKGLTKKSVQILIKQLYEFYESRRVLYGIAQLTKAVRAKTFNVATAKTKLKELSKETAFVSDDKSGDYIEDYDERRTIVMERMRRVDEDDMGTGIPTGLVRFDNYIGGIMPTEFGVVAGKTGVGKTATILAFAIHAWLIGKSVMFATGEMSKELIEFRMDSNLAGIPVQKFRTGDVDKKELRRWHSTIERLKTTLPGYFEVISFPRNFNIGDIESEIVRVEEMKERKIDLLCIDYINIMNPISKKGSSTKEWTEQAEVVWDLKGMAADLNLPVWTAGQIRDAGYDVDKLELDHLKYARAISETAPIVVGLVQMQDDQMENRIQFQVLKMRNAPLLEKPLYLHPNLQVMRIHERVVKVKDLLTLEDDVAPPPKKKKSTRRKL